jgi:polysaccharide deacetylase family protein (PEP-CTERM system associated)
LSVDVEEWSDARLAGIDGGARDRVPPSLDAPVDRLLELLAARGARATFFVLGRVARRYPHLVRRIAATYEIATHGDSHEDLRSLGPKRLAGEIRTSRAILQDLTGQEVVGFRAPHWSLGACLSWALPVLEDEGLLYDSSLLPGRGFAFLPGRSEAPRRPHRLGALWEFPPTVLEGPGFSVPAAGGAFLRALPRFALERLLQRATASGDLPHVCLHPWEFGPSADPGMNRVRAAILFAGSARLPAKMSRLLARFRGTAIADILGTLAAPVGGGV